MEIKGKDATFSPAELESLQITSGNTYPIDYLNTKIPDLMQSYSARLNALDYRLKNENIHISSIERESIHNKRAKYDSRLDTVISIANQILFYEIERDLAA